METQRTSVGQVSCCGNVEYVLYGLSNPECGECIGSKSLKFDAPLDAFKRNLGICLETEYRSCSITSKGPYYFDKPQPSSQVHYHEKSSNAHRSLLFDQYS